LARLARAELPRASGAKALECARLNVGAEAPTSWSRPFNRRYPVNA
jgi:hypothetical protein